MKCARYIPSIRLMSLVTVPEDTMIRNKINITCMDRQTDGPFSLLLPALKHRGQQKPTLLRLLYLIPKSFATFPCCFRLNVLDSTGWLCCLPKILTHKAQPIICIRRQIQILLLFHNLLIRNVCWQTILMKYHSLFLSKIRKDVANLSSAAVVL